MEVIVGSPEYGCIGRIFAHRVTRDDCLYVKPDPEPITSALALQRQTDFVYVGDSDHDAQAAEAAGGPFILVDTRGYSEDVIATLGPIARVKSLSGLTKALTGRYIRYYRRPARTQPY